MKMVMIIKIFTLYDSSELNRRNKDTGESVSGFGFNNNYFVEETDITYTGGDGDFSKDTRCI